MVSLPTLISPNFLLTLCSGTTSQAAPQTGQRTRSRSSWPSTAHSSDAPSQRTSLAWLLSSLLRTVAGSTVCHNSFLQHPPAHILIVCRPSYHDLWWLIPVNGSFTRACKGARNHGVWRLSPSYGWDWHGRLGRDRRKLFECRIHHIVHDQCE